ncbi:MAG TPA: DUF6069 family protein [Nocardioides sp.]|nr:DUF6069 family protein [Nocardioides sp.]
MSAFVRHVSAVLAAAGTAVTVYLLARYGFDLRIEEPGGEPRVTLGSVLGASVVSSALGWALLSGLERWATRGRTLWTRIAVTVTLLSVLGPLTTPDLTAGGRALLSVLHLLVGAVTIAVLLTVRAPDLRREPAMSC